MLTLPIVHHPAFGPPLPVGHRFPMAKFAALYARLVTDNLVSRDTVRVPYPITATLLKHVHDSNYVDSVLAGRVDPAVERRIGLPIDAAVALRARVASGGTLLTGRLALRHGLACNTAGGSHHARRAGGAGFCVFNDVAVAIRALQSDGLVGRVLVIDLDVHQGDGTAEIFAGDNSVVTFSAHCGDNFPLRKVASSRDVALPRGLGDDAYLAMLAAELPALFARGPYDLVFYNAGVDVHAADRLGHLALSDRGIAARDRQVIAACRARALPVAAVIGGGYADDIPRLAGRHAILHHVAASLVTTGT